MERATVTLKSGERVEVSAAFATLQRDMTSGISRCIGKCRCKIETDGHCKRGYPSRFEVLVEGYNHTKGD